MYHWQELGEQLVLSLCYVMRSKHLTSSCHYHPHLICSTKKVCFIVVINPWSAIELINAVIICNFLGGDFSFIKFFSSSLQLSPNTMFVLFLTCLVHFMWTFLHFIFLVLDLLSPPFSSTLQLYQ